MHQNTHLTVPVTRQGTQLGEYFVQVIRITTVVLSINGREYKAGNAKINWLGYQIEVSVKSHNEVELRLPIKLAKQLNLVEQTHTAQEVSALTELVAV